MKKDHVLVPEPNSKFNKVKCHECEEEQIVYSHSSTQVICNSCGNVLSKATGSIAQIKGKILDTTEIVIFIFCIDIETYTFIINDKIIFFNSIQITNFACINN